MKVTVQLFGAYRPFGDKLQVELPDGAKVADIRMVLMQKLEAMDENFSAKGLVDSSRFATDTEVLSETQQLEEDMVVAVIPPVAGG